MFNFTALPPLGLYIHYPWCVRKCPYCDFNSHEVKGDVPELAYINALVQDLEQDLPLVWGRRINSIFIGGGTPSLLSPESLDALLSSIRARLAFNPGIEITLEANPGAVDYARFEEFYSLGVNRISIGVQSFADHCLHALGRVHNSQDAVMAIESAQKAGFTNFNIDLMFGLPGQSMTMAENDINTAIALNPSHISYYQLTIEPNTLFYNKSPVLPVEENIYAIQQACQSKLAESGFRQYEVSAYASENHQCAHNVNYWQFGDYLGIGAGAHAKISNASEQNIKRYWKVKHPQDYIGKVATSGHISGSRTLSRKEAGFEFMMNALRLTDGFETELFTRHTGLPILVVEKQLKEAQLRGLIEWDVRKISPTIQGYQFLNDLLEQFLPDDPQMDGGRLE